MNKPENVTLYTDYFTSHTAQQWKIDEQYEHVIFLCDLRSGDGHDETQVADDMKNQREMTQAMQACYSVLKFRPPYYDETVRDAHKNRFLVYLDGTIYFQGYPPKNSTETRLHVTDTGSVKSYDKQVYQDQLFYHNQVTRNKQKVQFGPYDNGGERFISYDNAHARFVQRFLIYHLGRVSEGQLNDHGEPKFEHGKLRALLEEFKLLSTQS